MDVGYREPHWLVIPENTRTHTVHLHTPFPFFSSRSRTDLRSQLINHRAVRLIYRSPEDRVFNAPSPLGSFSAAGERSPHVLFLFGSRWHREVLSTLATNRIFIPSDFLFVSRICNAVVARYPQYQTGGEKEKRRDSDENCRAPTSRRVATLSLFSENTPSPMRGERSTNRVRFAVRHESNSLPPRNGVPVGLTPTPPLPPLPPPTPALPAGGREGGSSFATAPFLLSSTHYVPRTRVTVRQHALYAYTSRVRIAYVWEDVSFSLSLSFSSALSHRIHPCEVPACLSTAPDRVSRHRNM